MSENIYTTLGIDKSKLKRDYILKPLHIGVNQYDISELPLYDDFYYLYITLNLTRENVCKYFNFKSCTFKKICRLYNIKKSLKLINDNRENTCLKLYGNKNCSKIKLFTDKISTTKLVRYGNKNYNNILKGHITKMKNGS